ncbi:AAA family ATPase [Candidatus Woesearchaeota archaeon]|nr:AAA family ATPase [Candidatus Woesearchaeota archaeon]
MGILSRSLKDKDSESTSKINREVSIYEENQLLKASLGYMRAELSKFKELPLLVCEIKSLYNEGKAIIRVPNGNLFLVNVAGNLKLEITDTVVVEQKSLTIVEKLEKTKSFDVENFVIINKPNILYEKIGGLDEQINEIREVVELPLLKPELFLQMGIVPPKGILLYGPPGTGKTLLAKAVATSTNSTFIELVASELVQKFIGEGAKLVKSIFELARERAPAIIFIDEIDALAAERVDLATSGEREVNRTFMQLLTEIDGFNDLSDVKVIGATNRVDILDPAILRPGRFDRLIEVPLPEKKGRETIFGIHMKNMPLHKIDFDSILTKTDNFSGAEIKAVCTEAGYFAIRENRKKVKTEDFLAAIDKLTINEEESPLEMYG